MRAQLKRIHSPDAHDLMAFKPNDPDCFGLLLQLMVGPEGEDSEESFDVVLCSPKWLQSACIEAPLPGRHYLFQQSYDYVKVLEFVRAYCSACEGNTWQEIACLVGRLAKWEFEDYRE